MLTLSLIVASMTPLPSEPTTDVIIEANRIVFVQVDPDGTETREAYSLGWTAIDGDPDNPPTPFDVCYTAAVATCGVHNVKKVKFSSGPSGESCEFECGTNWPPAVQ